MARLARALRPGGAWFMSFKYGEGERFATERHFTDMTEASIIDAIGAAGLTAVDIWVSNDARPDRAGERWTNAIAKR
jgi:hypothetical protein